MAMFFLFRTQLHILLIFNLFLVFLCNLFSFLQFLISFCKKQRVFCLFLHCFQNTFSILLPLNFYYTLVDFFVFH